MPEESPSPLKVMLWFPASFVPSLNTFTVCPRELYTVTITLLELGRIYCIWVVGLKGLG